MGERREPRSQAMLRAVNRDVRALPKELQAGALVELARELARRFDGGDVKVAGELRRTVAELQRAAKPPARGGAQSKVNDSAVSAGQGVAERDVLDDIAEDRAARRDDLAPRRARRAGAADHDGAGAGSAAAGDSGR